MSTITVQYHQSRWGFHTCSYEDFKKIKLLYKHYWMAKKAKAAYHRYYNKLPHNRVIRKQNGQVLFTPIPMPVPFFPSIYENILRKNIAPLIYQQARHPHPTPDYVKPLTVSMSQVNEWLVEIEQAYSKK
jgi:hypothetical protein